MGLHKKKFPPANFWQLPSNKNIPMQHYSLTPNYFASFKFIFYVSINCATVKKLVC